MRLSMDEKQKRLDAFVNRPIPLASGYAMARIRVIQNFIVPSRAIALHQVDQILARGSFASMVNVGSGFAVKEMVLA
jgi:hypothetical protein